MILISLIHTTDTERNTTRKYRMSCYKKYRVGLTSGNIGITIHTSATPTNVYMIFLKISM